MQKTKFLLLLMFFFSLPAQQFGGQTMVSQLKKVLVRIPSQAFGSADPQKWHYTARPNLTAAIKEHNAFTDILRNCGVQVIYHDADLPNHADALFVHDPVILTDSGSIILRMGKHLRRGEEEAIEQTLQKLGIPTLFKLHGDAIAEGGDILWLDDKTLVIGRGYRTNDEGIRQIREVVSKLGIEVIQVDLPYDQGEEACLHLQSLISLVDEKVALVYKRFLPVSFLQFLEKREFEFIEVPEQEYGSMGPNVLAIAPKLCLTITGNPITKRRLEEAGCKVLTYVGDEMSLKAEGGATCLTRPLLRTNCFEE